MSTLAELEKHAEEIRKELAVPKQNELFKVATEVGYLAALADGEVGDDERDAVRAAIEVLSQGAVIEWEVDELLDGAEARVAKQGAKARVREVGEELKALGHAEPALLFAAFVAEASGGIDREESATLREIGKAAGVSEDRVGAIMKRVGPKR